MDFTCLGIATVGLENHHCRFFDCNQSVHTAWLVPASLIRSHGSKIFAVLVTSLLWHRRISIHALHPPAKNQPAKPQNHTDGRLGNTGTHHVAGATMVSARKGIGTGARSQIASLGRSPKSTFRDFCHNWYRIDVNRPEFAGDLDS